MATNQEFTELVALDLGIDIINRRPAAKEIFKWLDIDLLPHSSADTLLCEIYEWRRRNWRSTQDNLTGIIFPENELPSLKQALKAIPKEIANIPDFEFTKEDIIDVGLGIPSLFNIEFKGNVKMAKEISVKVNGVKKSRITNIDPPGIQIMRKLSEFARDNSKEYRRRIKRDYITEALFYADTVEIYLKKETNVAISVGFAVENVDVETGIDTDTEKKITLKYSGEEAPFAAIFKKGKAFFE